MGPREVLVPRGPKEGLRVEVTRLRVIPRESVKMETSQPGMVPGDYAEAGVGSA
jgi:hypothetical protein